MGGASNHPQIQDLSGWMRDVERRLLTQERRSTRYEVQRTLGPGFGRYAQQIFDWNGEQAWQVGQFWSDEGAFNSPNTLIPWLGMVRAASGIGGVQEVVALDGSLDRQQRGFALTPGAIPTFGAWGPI